MSIELSEQGSRFYMHEVLGYVEAIEKGERLPDQTFVIMEILLPHAVAKAAKPLERKLRDRIFNLYEARELSISPFNRKLFMQEPNNVVVSRSKILEPAL